MAAAAMLAGLPTATFAQPGPPPAPVFDLTPALTALKGKRVDEVSVRGNAQVRTGVILNQIRTRVGDAFDPATVAEDYQRVFDLRKFANVEAKVEPTPTGVSVVFVVTERRQITAVRFRGADALDDAALRGAIDLREGDAIDPFRITLARDALLTAYRNENYALAQVTVDEDLLSRDGVLSFVIVEGPRVRVRNIRFVGAEHFTNKLADQIKTSVFIPVFADGKYNPEQVEEDVASLQRFYESKGFFDARVGRKLVWSPDQTELQVDFVIHEGQRYTIDKITFERVGADRNTAAGPLGVSEEELRGRLKLAVGSEWDAEVLQRDIREIVRVYSAKYGYIYVPGSTDPDYLRVDAKPVLRLEAGKVGLSFQIREGREFYLGNVLIKGNSKSQDKLIDREFRDFTPGEKFNSGAMQDATERLRRLPYFGGQVTVTPVGEEPNTRDLLVTVNEARTATFNIGAGVNSNGGIAGNFVYEERNFDIGAWPNQFSDLGTDRAFKGAGQNFKAAFEPGTIQTGGYLRFSEPYLFDQPYTFTNELYLRTRVREGYDDQRLGDTVSIGHRFTYNFLAGVAMRFEKIDIKDIEDPKERAPEIVAGEGDSFLTSVALNARYDTTDPGLYPSRGFVTTARWEIVGALGGDHSFNRYNLGLEWYHTLHEDLLERRTILSIRTNAGYIAGGAPFFERFYAGGIGSIRGFKFRGVSPRDGLDEDPIGGDFLLTGTAEVGFPLAGDALRGVVFTDVGTVEPSMRIGTLRTAVGAGVRVQLPFLGQVPLAIDFAFPLVKDDQDETQVISFSFGFTQ